MSGALHEALRAVTTSVERLRDEVLPDICGRLREIESSPALAEGAPGQDRQPAQSKLHKKYEANQLAGGSSGQSPAAEPPHEGELREMVASLHERLEVRMQKMYEEHSARWVKELEGLQKHVEVARPGFPRQTTDSSGARPTFQRQTSDGSGGRPTFQRQTSDGSGGRPTFQRQASGNNVMFARMTSAQSCYSVTSPGRPTFVGSWRDPTGAFLSGRTIVIAEDGWCMLDAARAGNAAATDSVEVISPSKMRLLMPLEEGSSADLRASFDVELEPDDTLTVNSTGSPTCTLYRVHRRDSRSHAPSEYSALNTVYKHSDSRNSMMLRFAASRSNCRDLATKGRLQLLYEKITRKLAFFKTRNYELVQVVMIMLDAAFLSWRTQRAAEVLINEPHECVTAGIRDNIALVLINDFFCFWYIVDVVGRALSMGWLFCEGAECAIHCFEAFVTAAFIMEVIAVHVEYDEGYLSTFRFWVELVSFARTLRLLRLVHYSRFVRYNTAFRELRLMMYALQGALKSLVWSTVMLVVIFLITGTIFTNGYIRHVVYNGHVRNPQLGDLEGAFGTLAGSMFTLFKAVTNGVDWAEVYALLEPLEWPYKGLYVGFQLFASLALLNVITAVFVESTMQRSGKDRESAIVEELNGRRELLAKIDALFDDFDDDHNEQISREELKAHMQDKDIAAYFSSLGVDVDQVGKLFELLDQDHSGFIEREEFVQGCVHLKGEAKSVDLALLHADVDALCQMMQDMSEVLQACVGARQPAGAPEGI